MFDKLRQFLKQKEWKILLMFQNTAENMTKKFFSVIIIEKYGPI